MFDLRNALRIGILLWLITPSPASAQRQGGSPAIGFLESSQSLPLRQATPLPKYLLQRPVRRIELVTAGGRWVTEEPLDKKFLGQPLTAALARQVMRSILRSGRFAEISAEAFRLQDGVVLRVTVLPRRVVDELRVTGSALGSTPTFEAADIEVGDEITVHSLPAIDKRVTDLYRKRGFPQAYVRTQAIDTNDLMRVVLVVGVHAGPERTLTRRRFKLDRPNSTRLQALLQRYGVKSGERADEIRLEEADAALTEQLRAHRFPQATVTHSITDSASSSQEGFLLTVDVRSRAETHLHFEGNHSFEEEQLRAFLSDDLAVSRGNGSRAEHLEQFYFTRGFLDASVKVHLRQVKSPRQVHSIFKIHEGNRISVRRRRFPCLTAERTEQELRNEIDSFLAESLPAESFFGPVDSNELDRRLGSGRSLDRRATPLTLDPYLTYHRETYDKALAHLTALYRSEGYLSAVAGPLRVVRRRCDRRSSAGQCITRNAPLPPSIDCRLDAPLLAVAPEAPLAVPVQCVPDSARAIRCENSVELEIPIRLGPRAVLWDMRFEGNQHLVETQLASAAEMPLGAPISQQSLEKARRRLIHRYEEDGYAFAGVEASIELSPDRSRGRALFRINERQPVVVRDLVIRGARFTSKSLITSRIALARGQLYRRSLARTTEDQLISLGVFTSVTVSLEDSDVPARDKVVVIDLQERLPQYLDVRPGFSNGQGLRVSFEYGHRNLLQRAVQLSFRLQLGYLPPELVNGTLQKDFRALQEKESIKFLLQHRISLTLGLPEMGWGPAYRLDLEGLNVRDIFQKFARDKTALIATLSRRTDRRFRIFGGASLEFNEADVYISVLNDDDEGAALLELREQNKDNPALLSLLNIPDGLTFAVAQRAGFTWDRRDNAVSATDGTLVSFNLEHVDAYPLEASSRDRGLAETPRIKSHFLRYSGRVAAYFPLNSRGLTLATSFRWGFNQQLVAGSETYPDRLFFLGGVNSLRGFNLRTVMPADAQRDIDSQNRPEETSSETLADEAPTATESNEATGTATDMSPAAPTFDLVEGELIRGGNLIVNPRAELRIPLSGIWNTVLFLDTGNLWVKPTAAWEKFELRYTAGTGLRATTPVGPLAVDLGFNLFPRSKEERDNWFAFHFSIGLY